MMFNSKEDKQLNFDDLVKVARETVSKEAELNLYSSFLNLKYWVFIVSTLSSIESPKPFIGVVDNVPWLFVFTDREKAHAYASITGQFLTKDGSTLMLQMTPGNVLPMAAELYQRGVYGVRVNDGEYGWFCSIPALLSFAASVGIEMEFE